VDLGNRFRRKSALAVRAPRRKRGSAIKAQVLAGVVSVQ
jgi:hypothetical protein